ncbi:MAG: hypothetical protein COS92_03700 [Desulfobacterales bacterium CG07_land_8_20_14_0_80_52_14]|nr:MAG: hypothetical protein COX20_06980 [Desulfobacterales bacterium CG23_combo_of_CG06-09_8_20_14_all_52_9]PIU49987.1 MAG: hypothetical protein COS92_03700 [Desulfobacterales bacterium CG07_land_8_20_14_0_80_52_14]
MGVIGTWFAGNGVLSIRVQNRYFRCRISGIWKGFRTIRGLPLFEKHSRMMYFTKTFFQYILAANGNQAARIFTSVGHP